MTPSAKWRYRPAATFFSRFSGDGLVWRSTVSAGSTITAQTFALKKLLSGIIPPRRRPPSAGVVQDWVIGKIWTGSIRVH